MYYAFYLPTSIWKGFPTHNAADDYIKSRRCKACRQIVEEKGDEWASCDAEWDILNESDVTEMQGLPLDREIK